MTELQNDRQDKNNMPPDLRSRDGGIKSKFNSFDLRLHLINEHHKHI